MRSRRKYSSIWRSKQRPCPHRRHRWPKYLGFLLPSLLGVSFFVLAPFADVVRRSFMTALSGKACGLSNYAAVLQNQAFGLAVRNTIRFEVLCLPILLAGSLALALAMQSITALERWKASFLLPMAMPAATVALVWRLVFAKQGFLSGLLGRQCAFLEGGNAFWVLMLTYVWKNLGYTMVLWLAALKTVPTDIKEAAKVDGAGAVRIFFHVTLPWLKGAAYTISLLSFLNTFKVFREVYLIGGAYPSEEIYMLQHVFHNWYTRLELDKMAAGAVLSAVVLGALALSMGRLLEEREDAEPDSRRKRRKTK